MKFRNSLLLPLLPIASATWSTLYSSDSSIAYIYTESGSLYTFPTNSSTFSVSQAQSMFVQISSPPVNSTLVLDQNSDTLTAVYGASGCGTSSINIATYDQGKDTWTKVNSSPDNWYLEMPTVWAQPQTNLIYIFGGFCDTTNLISDTLYAYNTSSGEFSTPPNQNSPTELYAAGVTAITPSTFLLVGGRAKNGWISMSQVAVWEYNSWTFRTTGNSQQVDSRTNPLLVPIWTDNEQQSASSVLVLGGSVDGRAAEPFAVNLNLGNGWQWSNSSLDSALNPSEIDGALAVGNALLTLSESSSDKLSVKIYDMDSGSVLSSAKGFPTVTPTSINVPTQTVTVSTEKTAPPPSSSNTNTSSPPLSKGGIAALSTVLPLSAVCLLGIAGGIFFIRKRRRSKEQIRTMHLSPAPSMSDFINVPLTRQNNDSWYSVGGDTASINSWNEKRAIYEENVNRNSTLSQTTAKEGVVSSSPPSSPGRPTSNYRRSSDDDEDGNIFQGRDVQILVSSLRRTPLRVVNPDEESVTSASISRPLSTIQPPPPPPPRALPSFSDNLISRSSSVQEGGSHNRDKIHVHKRNLSNISSANEPGSAITNTQRSSSGTLNRRIPSHNTT